MTVTVVTTLMFQVATILGLMGLRVSGLGVTGRIRGV